MNLSIVPVMKITHRPIDKFPQHASILIFENEVDWTDSITYRYKTREIVVRQKDLYQNPAAAALVLKSMIEDSVTQITKQNVQINETS